MKPNKIIHIILLFSLCISARGQDEEISALSSDSLKQLIISQMHISLRKGIEYCDLRMQLAKNNKDPELIADTWNANGNLHWASNLFDVAEEYYQKAFHIYDSTDNNDKKASILHNLGLLAYENDDTLKCLDFYKRSVKLRKQFSSQIRVGDELTTLGEAYLSFNDYNNSIRYLFEALEYYADTTQYRRKMDAYSYLVDNFLVINPERSMEWINLLMHENEEMNSSEYSSMINFRLFRYNLQKNNIYEAEEYLKQVDTDSIFYREVQDPVKPFTDIARQLKASGRHSEAIRYMELSRSISEKQTENITRVLISNYKTRHNIRSAEEEIASTNQLNNIILQRIKIRKTISIVFYLAIFIISLGILYMLYSYFSYRISLSNLEVKKRNLEDTNKKSLKYKESILNIKTNKNLFFSIIGMKLSKPFFSLLDDLFVLNQHASKKGKDGKLISLLKDFSLNAARIEENLQRVLLWSKLQRNKYSINKEEIHLGDYFHELLPELIQKALKKDIKLRFDIEPELIVKFDRHSLKTIIRVFTENSIDHSGTKADIILRGQQVNNGIIISVTDFGKGIDANMQNHVFDVNRINMSEFGNDSGNLGLGLLIAKHMAEKNNSHLSFESKAGSGTTFFIHIKEKHD